MSGWARPSIFFSAPHCCILTETTGVLSALAMASDAECTLSAYVVTEAVTGSLVHAMEAEWAGGGSDDDALPAARLLVDTDALSAPAGRVTEAAAVAPAIEAPLSGTPSRLLAESLCTPNATDAVLTSCGASPAKVCMAQGGVATICHIRAGLPY